MLDRLLVEIWLRTRDEGTFRLLYLRHAPAMWRLALRLNGGKPSTAEEIVQDAWLRAVERLPEFRWQAALRTWLCGFVVNRWREDFRRERFENQRFMALESELSRPDKQTDLSEKIDLATALDELPEALREVFGLHDLEGFKHREIANMLGIPEGTSKSRLSDARQALRQFFDAESARLTP